MSDFLNFKEIMVIFSYKSRPYFENSEWKGLSIIKTQCIPSYIQNKKNQGKYQDKCAEDGDNQ